MDETTFKRYYLGTFTDPEENTLTDYLCDSIKRKQENVGLTLGALGAVSGIAQQVLPPIQIKPQKNKVAFKGTTAQGRTIIYEITTKRFITRLKDIALFSGSTRYFGEGDDIDYFLNIDNDEHNKLWFQILEHLGIKKERFHKEGELHPASDYKFVNIKAMFEGKIINVILLDTELFIKCERSTNKLMEMIRLFPEIKSVLKNNKEFRILCFIALEEDCKTKTMNDLLSNLMG